MCHDTERGACLPMLPLLPLFFHTLRALFFPFTTAHSNPSQYANQQQPLFLPFSFSLSLTLSLSLSLSTPYSCYPFFLLGQSKSKSKYIYRYPCLHHSFFPLSSLLFSFLFSSLHLNPSPPPLPHLKHPSHSQIPSTCNQTTNNEPAKGSSAQVDIRLDPTLTQQPLPRQPR